MLSCAYTTQLLHSTVEVCWNNNDSYFIWFKFVCRNSGTDSFQEVLEAVLFGVGVYLQMLTVWLLCGSPIRVSTTFNLRVGFILFAMTCIANDCVSLVFLFWGEVGKISFESGLSRVRRVGSPKSESRRVKLLRDGCACGARVKLGMRNVRRVHLTRIFGLGTVVTLRVGDLFGSV